ncbi:MAG TPA: L,D-transpeptidase family protein [Nitrosomonas nitrosa]|uniref:L,D-transpeptidase ErfK/SrfK n=1 Tax=Nitrosomonas nitrosa TaxID=52442 RepID=A0A1I4NVE1_9PROT|nr:L,D-transpeptidase family protein [Nitrosomonas nitrosa]SFM19375.1 L,D-transpeptidase ErfK/SrfK [Nitrosomonas nitrosa]HNP51757.1 L,D-transpeptidase family protein [Nitrosomonas nitrosa]
MRKFFLLLATLLATPWGQAASWILPPADIDIFGQLQVIPASRDETLLDIARRYSIGQDEMLWANPLIDRWLPPDGADVVIPSRYIIPQAERNGLVINLPEMRLYYFPKPEKGKKPTVITYPISIGRMDWRTPLGKTTVVRKQKDPPWIPPQSIKMEAIAAGNPPLPDYVPPGPNNPLGRHALYLGTAGYLIHGTDKPYGIGMRVTHGCLRMYPEDIESLFDRVPIGTPVQLINQPIKLGWLADSLFIELHPPLEEDEEQYADYMQKVREEIDRFLEKSNNDKKANSARKNIVLDEQMLELAVFQKSGYPVMISK